MSGTPRITCIAAALAALCIGVRAEAHSSGVSGYSGKDVVICTSCHLGGVAPLVHFEGPDTVAPDSVTSFRFLVQSQSAEQPQAGFDVAASDGELVPGPGAKLLSGELTHTQPRDVDAEDTVAWEFFWHAPLTAGTARLFGAGNSVDGFLDTGGDGSAAAVFDVTVGGAAATPTPSPSPQPTATITPRPCPGDCRGDGAVGIDELVTAVQVALGLAPVDACTRADDDGDGEVSVAEIVAAVANSLDGCP